MAELLENEEQELMKFLQIDGKGWKVDLFENENSILHVLCAKCGLVCRDAVELGCEHSDSQIFLYCNDCLNNLIANNNEHCPINNHSNPIIIRNRATRRLISTSIMLCPYSIKYKQKMNRIMETSNNFEEKEGINQEIIKGCNFKGTIDNLLQNHILKCRKTNNPLFTQNIIQNKYKNKINKLNQQNKILTNKNVALQNQLNKQSENQKLNEKINKQNEMSLKNQLNHLTNKNEKINEKCLLLQTGLNKQNQLRKMNERKNKQRIVSLENEIEMLKKKLITSNDKIMCLQMVSNQHFKKQKQNNNIFNEKKNDENYNPGGTGILWGIHGHKMKINGKRVTFYNNDNGSLYENSVMSTSNLLKKGKYKIKIKVLEKSDYCNIIIGIVSTTLYKNSCCFGWNRSTYNYGYSSEGSKYSNDGEVAGVSGYSSNDIISINIDLSIGRIWFFKNNNKRHECQANIKRKTSTFGQEITYYMAVSMSSCGGNSKGSIAIV